MTSFSVPFQVGQRFKVQDTDKGFELTALYGEENGCTILTVGADYLEFEESATEVKLRLPFFLIRTVHVKAVETEAETETVSTTIETVPEMQAQAA